MSGSNIENERGFTVVEVSIAMVVMSILAVAFLGIISSYYVVIFRNNARTDMTINAQNLLRTTVENIRYGNGVRQTNQLPDANAPGGGWNTNNSAFVIIIPVPALDSSRQYIIDPNTGQPYMNELVYYKNGLKLMERILANPAATGNRLQTTCPANLASSTCRADPELADYVQAMTFTLFDQNADTTNIAANARSVKITLNMQRNAPGDPINVANSIRVTLRNRF